MARHHHAGWGATASGARRFPSPRPRGAGGVGAGRDASPAAAAPRRAALGPSPPAAPGRAPRPPPRSSAAIPVPRLHGPAPAAGHAGPGPPGRRRGRAGARPPTPPVGAARPVPARNGPRAACSCPYVLTGGGERSGRQQPRGREAPTRCRRAAGAVQKGGGCAQKRLGAGGEGTRSDRGRGPPKPPGGLQRTPSGVGVAAGRGDRRPPGNYNGAGAANARAERTQRCSAPVLSP